MQKRFCSCKNSFDPLTRLTVKPHTEEIALRRTSEQPIRCQDLYARWAQMLLVLAALKELLATQLGLFNCKIDMVDLKLVSIAV